MKIVDDIEDLLALQRNGASAPFAQFCDNLGLRVGFEAADEVPAVLVNPREAAVLEVRQVKDQQPSAEPRSSVKFGTVVGTFAGKADFLDGPVSDVVEQVELRSSLLLAESLVFLVEKSVQPQNGCVGDHHVFELIEFVANSVGNGDLVEFRSTRSRRYAAKSGVNRW